MTLQIMVDLGRICEFDFLPEYNIVTTTAPVQLPGLHVNKDKQGNGNCDRLKAQKKSKGTNLGHENLKGKKRHHHALSIISLDEDAVYDVKFSRHN